MTCYPYRDIDTVCASVPTINYKPYLPFVPSQQLNRTKWLLENTAFISYFKSFQQKSAKCRNYLMKHLRFQIGLFLLYQSSQINLIVDHPNFERFSPSSYCFLILQIVSLIFKQGSNVWGCYSHGIFSNECQQSAACHSEKFFNLNIRRYIFICGSISSL